MVMFACMGLGLRIEWQREHGAETGFGVCIAKAIDPAIRITSQARIPKPIGPVTHELVDLAIILALLKSDSTYRLGFRINGIDLHFIGKYEFLRIDSDSLVELIWF